LLVIVKGIVTLDMYVERKRWNYLIKTLKLAEDVVKTYLLVSFIKKRMDLEM